MIKKILLIIFSLLLFSNIGFAQTGTYTTNGYFYLPAYGEYGIDAFNEYETYMQIADTQIEYNKNHLTDDDLSDNTLDDLSDVNTATVTDKHVLVADGVDFESRALVEADISDLQLYATKSEASTTIYCNYSTGSDSTGDGSSGNPYKTIQKAVDSLPNIIDHSYNIYVGASESLTDTIDFTGKQTQISGSIDIIPRDSSDTYLYKSGNASGGSTTTLEHIYAGWDTDQWAGGYVYLRSGDAKGEIRTISSNTSDTLTIENGTAISSNDSYTIVLVSFISSTTAFQNLSSRTTIKGFRFDTSGSRGIYTIGADEITISYCLFDDPSNIVYFKSVQNFYIADCLVNYTINYKTAASIDYSSGRLINNIIQSVGSSSNCKGFWIGNMSNVYTSGNTFADLSTAIQEAYSTSFIYNIGSNTFNNCETDYSIKKEIFPTQSIPADDTTPDISNGSTFITSANTTATAITDLDNPTVGETITIIGGSDTFSSTIADSGNFKLSAAMTLGLDDSITLYVKEDNYYIELSRSTN